MKMLSTTVRPMPAGLPASPLVGRGAVGISVPSSKIRVMLSILLPGGIGGNDSAALDVSKRTRDHCSRSCGAGVGVESFEQPPTKEDPSPPPGSVYVTLKRGAPAPQCPPSR